MTLRLTREQILAHRRRVTHLGERLPFSPTSLEAVAAPGLQDSMPRAALLSIHARMEGTTPTTWSEPPLAQVWGPRFSAFVIAERDRAPFTVGRLPDDRKARQRCEEVARRLADVLGEERMDVRQAARLARLHPNALRYAAPTGRFLIFWDGARQPLIWTVPAPTTGPVAARLELARRYLHTFGPATASGFAAWAGIRPGQAVAAFAALASETIRVRTPIGDGLVLAADEAGYRGGEEATSTRLLPSGDTYFLLQGEDRALLVPDEACRNVLWTPRVWPGAVLCGSEIVGTWRRAEHKVTILLWGALDPARRESVEAEAASLPLPGITRPVTVSWQG